ncbi:alpha-D-ribose 1-methylphosphonate 5-triphosphate synthase subunit PhnH [Sporomusaceae bacterium BoRhaA]|uniref:phosphonate C-P lyase system protein PhnH n=1 Tax=Pelorhabdus rhamnosifermentans TaxID=2772457 RepID=UPI001C061FBF|nr:phosphonate C-P lyase system protein PhnH [Pelorhabdus rhamnosifermentans]MBU2699508.1 alpha-D-ribose 1-methylphosphonate 5-triphosphate synthase subunit PhnH [Pelorhabdus rhamnosifermentans]
MIETRFDKVFDTQRIYRLVLDAMARPGTVNSLSEFKLQPPAGLNQAAAAVALTLFDSETCFSVLPSDQAISDYLRFNTGAAVGSVSDAEFVLVNGREEAPEIHEMCCGTLISPEKGATLLMMVDSLVATAHGSKLVLRGPGIKDSSCLNISGLDKENIRAISELNQEYPLGIDVIYLDHAGNVACVPRSSSLRWEGLS